MRKTLLGIVKVLLLALGLLSLAAIGETIAFRLQPLPLVVPNPLEAQLKGKNCELWEDPQGISHARGDQKLTALACLGFLHGRDRAWQLDYFKRTWQGRRSEILGLSELHSDFSMRLIGLEAKAWTLFSAMAPDLQSWFWAYTYGVNRGMGESMARGGSYEFKQLGHRPELWRPQDSIALLLLQGFDQTKESFIRQIEENDYAGEWGEQAAQLFARTGVPWDTSIIKEEEQAETPTTGTDSDEAPAETFQSSPAPKTFAHQHRSPKAGKKHLSWLDGLGRGLGNGSNNWVIAPSRSATGNAWLANDPHLDLKHPPFWYWMHLESPEFDAIGATLPGTPAIASGANRHVAWGITNSYLNVTRLAFVPQPDLAKEELYERPWIWFKLGPLRLPFFFKSFSRTSEGWPVLPIDAPLGHAPVLRWTGYELGPEDFRGLFELPESDSTQAADLALSHFGIPSWNFVMADDQGKIGYRAVGKVAGNSEELPFGIPRMSLEQLRALPAFAHFLTPDEMPHLESPKRGFIATANNRQWPDSSEWDIGRAHAESFRAFRIEEMILETPQHDLESIRRAQCDVQAVDARFLLPQMVQALGEPPAGSQGDRERRVLKTFREWDEVATLNCAACPMFQRWLDKLLTDDDLDDSSLYRMLAHKDEGFRQDVREALNGALDELHIGTEGPLPLWSSLHLASFPHLAGAEHFTAPSIATPGDDASVNPGTSDWENGIFHHIAGASQRMIVELSSPPQVYSVLAGSNSDLENRDPGLAGSEWQKWLGCQQQKREFPLDWSKVKIQLLSL